MAEKSDINFVKRDRNVMVIRAKRSYIIQTLSMFVLGAYTLGLIIVFSYNTILVYQNKMTERAVASEIKQIEKLTPIEAKYLILKQKAEAAVKTTQSLYRYQDLMQTLFELIPSDLLVGGFTVDSDDNVLFSAKTANPETLNDFISRVKQYNSLQTNSELLQAEITGISVSNEGVYNLNVKLFVKFKEIS